MKKHFAFLFWILYLFAGSTIVHSFCAQEHLERSEEASHICCESQWESSDKDCFEHCLWEYENSYVQSHRENDDNVDTLCTQDGSNYKNADIDFLQKRTSSYWSRGNLSESDRLKMYVWVIKKLE